MGFSMKTTDELVSIVAAGGGLVFDPGRRSTEELIRISTAAKRGGATVVFKNMALRKTDALLKIAAAGRGNVIFDS
jgi:hypothetical protein